MIEKKKHYLSPKCIILSSLHGRLSFHSFRGLVIKFGSNAVPEEAETKGYEVASCYMIREPLIQEVEVNKEAAIAAT